MNEGMDLRRDGWKLRENHRISINEGIDELMMDERWDRIMKGWMNEGMDLWKDGFMEGWIYGGMDLWRDESMEG